MNLANKYRPRFFREVLGQRETIAVLGQILKAKDYPSAILFMGGWGSGKTTLARIFSMAILCTDRQEHDPCGKCGACQTFLEGKAVNFNEIDAASSGSVADVRQIVEESYYRSVGGSGKKVLLIDECHMLSKQAQSAFLKLLEEGSENMIFLFCTTDPEKILPTVISRCLPFKIREIPMLDIVNRLKEVCAKEGIECEDEALKLIVAAKRGHVRDCLMLVDQLRYGPGIRTASVRSILNLDLDLEYCRLLTSIDGDVVAISAALDGLIQRASVREIYEGLSRVSLSVFKYTHGVVANLDSSDLAWMAKLAEKLGPRSLKIAEYLSSKTGLSYPASLECDLLALRHCWLEGFPGESQLNLKKETKKVFASELERIDYYGVKQMSQVSSGESLTILQIADILGGRVKSQ